MQQLRYKEFAKLVYKKCPRLTISGGKGSEIKVFGSDANGVHRIHIMGCHGKNPTFSKHKIASFLYKFQINPKDFFD